MQAQAAVETPCGLSVVLLGFLCKNSMQAQAAVETSKRTFSDWTPISSCKNSMQAQAAVETGSGPPIIFSAALRKNSMQAQAAVETIR